MGIEQHFNRLGNLLDITRHTHHIDHALAGWQNIFGPIALARIRHNCEFHPRGFGIVIPRNFANILFIAVAERTKISFGEHLLGVSVPNFHIVDTRRDTRFIHGLHKIIIKMMIIHQTAIADRTIEYLEFRAVGNPGCFHKKILPFGLKLVKNLKQESSYLLYHTDHLTRKYRRLPRRITRYFPASLSEGSKI